MKSVSRPSRPSPEITFRSRVRKFSPEGGMHYLEVPSKAFKQLGSKFRVRLIATVPDAKLRFHCALMPVAGGKACIYFSKEKMKKAQVSDGDALSVRVKFDRSKYGMKVPAELMEVLKQNPEALRRFDGLTPGKQRNIIFDVSTGKDSDRRVNRAYQLMEDLQKMPEGKESMQILLSTSKDRKKIPASAVDEDAAFRSKFLPIDQAPPSKPRTRSKLR